jgi:hypothetical protein
MFSSSIFPSIFQLPTEILQSLIQHICAVPNEHVRIALSLAVLSVPEPRQHDLNISIELVGSSRIDVLRNWLPRIGPGLVEINNENPCFDDDFLLGLSSSASARTLKRLNLDAASITDASAAAWPRFSALEVLDLPVSGALGIETLRATSRIPSLRKLNNYIDITADQCLELYSDRLPELENVQISVHEIPEDDESQKKLLDMFRQRTNLKSLFGFQSAPAPFLLEIHKILPNLVDLNVTFDSSTLVAEVLLALPHCRALRTLSLLDVDTVDITSENVQKIASHCPNLENLYLEVTVDSANIGYDFSIFSSLKRLQLSCENIHKVTKFPASLLDLSLVEAGADADEFADEEKQLFIDSICTLTRLQYLSVNVNANFFIPSRFDALTHALTSLQQLTLVQQLPVADDTVEVALNTLPFVKHLFVKVPNLGLDPARVYLPAVSAVGDDVNAFVPLSCSTAQLPNLTNLGEFFSDNARERGADNDFLLRFGPQLRDMVDPTNELPISTLCTFSNLSSVVFSRSISCDEAAQLLQSLHRLDRFDVTCNGECTNFDWLKHPRVSSLMLTLDLDPGSVGDPHLQFTAKTTPSLHELRIFFTSDLKPKVTFSELNNLHELSLFCSAEGVQVSFELRDCPSVELGNFTDIFFTSLSIFNVNRLKHLHFSNVRLPSPDLIRLSAPRLQSAPFDDVRESDDDGQPGELAQLLALNKKE